MTNKKFSLNNIVQVLILIASVILSVYFYQIFPAVVPTHWGISGQANSFGPKWVGAFVIPIIIFILYFIFSLLPKIDPKHGNYEDFKQAYNAFKTAIMAVLFAIYLITSLNIIGVAVSVSLWVPALIGLFMVIIGKYLGQVKSNYLVGIRTPWTLNNEDNWNKTHSFGVKVFVVGGLLLSVDGLLPNVWRMPLFLTTIIIIVLVPIVYSYVLYRKQK